MVKIENFIEQCHQDDHIMPYPVTILERIVLLMENSCSLLEVAVKTNICFQI